MIEQLRQGIVRQELDNAEAAFLIQFGWTPYNELFWKVPFGRKYNEASGRLVSQNRAVQLQKEIA